jgi:hypothetical protein
VISSDKLFEVIYIDDPRIKRNFTRELEGEADIHIHYDPRSVGVFALPTQAKMWSGESVEIDLDERAMLLGVITELAAHHPRARLHLNGLNMTPQYLDTFLIGHVDGVGCIKWFILPSGKKHVKITISDSYNPMLPPPVHTTVGWSLDDLNSDVIPKDGGVLDVGDVPHPCELQMLKLGVDSSQVEISFIDGWGEGAIMNPNWRTTLEELHGELAQTKSHSIDSYATLLRWDEKEKIILINLPASFMAGMRVRLKNLSKNDIKLTSMRCLAKVRVC